MQFKDLFFDRAASDQPVNRHGALLTNSVSAVGGLVFDGGVRPGMHVDHIVGGCQVQTGAASFQADQKDVAVTRLERVDSFLSLLHRSAAVEVLVRNSALLKVFAKNREMVHKLAEDEHLVISGQQFVVPAALDDAPLIDPDHDIGVALGQIDFVGDEERGARLAEPAEGDA